MEFPIYPLEGTVVLVYMGALTRDASASMEMIGSAQIFLIFVLSDSVCVCGI